VTASESRWAIFVPANQTFFVCGLLIFALNLTLVMLFVVGIGLLVPKVVTTGTCLGGTDDTK
jgi:hypothetical protein